MCDQLHLILHTHIQLITCLHLLESYPNAEKTNSSFNEPIHRHTLILIPRPSCIPINMLLFKLSKLLNTQQFLCNMLSNCIMFCDTQAMVGILWCLLLIYF